MHSGFRLTAQAAVLAAALLLVHRPAYGYLDPGTGSFIFQILIGGLLGAMFAMKACWRRAWAFIAIRLRRQRPPQ